MYNISLIAGVIVSMFYTELTSLSAGLVVSGYLALCISSPLRIGYTLLLAIVSMALCRLIANRLILFGQRRFAVMIIISFLLDLLLRQTGLIPMGFDPVGVVIPGIIARCMDRQGIVKTLTYTLLTFWGIVVLFPFFWMVLTSIKSYGEYNSEYIPKFYSSNPTVQNYLDAFTQVPLAQYFLNTLIFTVITTAVMLVVITLAAFAFARLEFKGKDALFVVFLSMMMIPNELVIITNFVTITDLDMRNTFAGLILPSIMSVFYLYLLKETFQQIPDNLYQAAKVDGTSDFKYLLKVMIPIAKPTLVTITILKIIECWNSYVWPRLITDDAAYFLVSNGIQEIRENGFGRENIPAMMAAVVVITLPLIVLFLIFRNKIMEGVSRGGTKG